MRQSDLPSFEKIERPPRGLLRQKLGFEHFGLSLYAPSEDLIDFIEHHWLIQHDLGTRPPYRQQNLPHPSQHLVINPQGETAIFGASTGVFSYTLKGTGRVLGTKFYPGAFRGLFGKPVSALTDRIVLIESVFPVSAATLADQFQRLNDPVSMIAKVEGLLRGKPLPLDAKAIKARQIVAHIDVTKELCTVAALARHFAMTARSLERLFDNYIGVSPKQVIDRYRMIEAADSFNRGDVPNLAELAQRLGYFDQSHFSKSFQALTGKPPSFFV